jgi:hypothetical protein
LTRLDTAEAIMALVKHSVALPLLPKNLVQRHMAAVTDIARKVPVWQMRVPHGLDRGRETLEHLKQVFQ